MVLFLSGCVTAKKYRMAKDDAPPVRRLDWPVATPAAELNLATVIIYKGPGSWKREARWDEYVISLTNGGAQPLTIETAELIDLLGLPQLPGIDPWALEKLSHTNWDKYGKTGLKLLAGAGVVVIYSAAATVAAMGSIMAGGAATGGAVVVLSVIPVVAVVNITAVMVMNSKNKAKVVAEFDRRRLDLSLPIAPGETVSGSLFFPMTPGPQRLHLRGRSGGEPVELVLELKPLATLHLQPAGN